VEQAPDFRYVGELFRTYILVEQGEELILIDKHAAHERINFERLLAQGTRILGQTLLQPQACRFDREEAAVLLEHRELLLSLGYDLDDLGQGDLLLRQIPSDIRESDAAATLSEIAGHLRDGRLDSPQRLRDEALHTIACKAAIKAGYVTDPQELQALAKTVLTNPNLKYCPHGRPICTVISKRQIEKQFKRIT
jgi:DNA mismatch repair protein MutL